YVVKADYPLREYILGSKKEQAGEGEFSQLRYISLNSIPQPSNNANKNVPPQENSGETIERILKDHVRKLTIEKTWFDERGLFNVDAFLSTLKSENIVVKSFSEQSNLNEWGEAVKQVLFSAELKKTSVSF
ncbi:hypothetical protein UB33_21705, partial [Photobacterium angustum]